MIKIAVFPGSFDPFTKGHENIVHKALNLFDEVIIAIGINSTKASYYELESRKTHILSLFENDSRISVQSYKSLTTEFCKKNKANFILRGLRDGKDFDYEKSIAQINHEIAPQIETVFLIAEPSFAHLNSSIIKEIAKNGGVIDTFVTNSDKLVLSI